MASGQYENSPQSEDDWSHSIKSAVDTRDLWSPAVKQEPRWVQYVSDDSYHRVKNAYGVEPLEPLESLEPFELLQSEQLEMPELDFPVPAPDLIPEMVRENELGSSTPVTQSEADADAANLLIPIQGSIVAHSRSGKPSIAAVTERRVKNTEAARRSRARRADKLQELRQRNEELSKRNVALVAENEQLRAVVRALETKLHISEN